MPIWEIPADIAAGMLFAIITGALLMLPRSKSDAYGACYMMRKWMIAGFLGQAIFLRDYPCLSLAIGFGMTSTLQLHWIRRRILREKRNAPVLFAKVSVRDPSRDKRLENLLHRAGELPPSEAILIQLDRLVALREREAELVARRLKNELDDIEAILEAEEERL